MGLYFDTYINYSIPDLCEHMHMKIYIQRWTSSLTQKSILRSFYIYASYVFYLMANDKQWIMHDWSDEDCVKILKRCKQAITSKGDKKLGKVIIIDMVRENQNEDEGSIETQLLLDLEMMVAVIGMERNEKEWAKLFLDAGFLNYKIHPVLGTRALIELYP